jgi:hypothetical protein
LSNGDLGIISICLGSIVKHIGSELTVTGGGQDETDEVEDIMLELGLVDVP